MDTRPGGRPRTSVNPTAYDGLGSPATWGAGDFSILANGSVLVGERLCETLLLRAKERLLDVATGSGNTALSAARRRAHVTAVDFVPELLVRGRARAAVERLRVDFQLGDAQALPFRDGAFDVVASTFGIPFVPDPARAASEMIRVVRPGGRIGLTAWTPDGAFGRLLEVTSRFAPSADPAPQAPKWGTVEGVRAIFEPLAESIRTEARDLWVRADSPGAFVEGYLRYFGPFRRVFESLDGRAQDRYRDELSAAITSANRSPDPTLLAPLGYLETVVQRVKDPGRSASPSAV